MQVVGYKNPTATKINQQNLLSFISPKDLKDVRLIPEILGNFVFEVIKSLCQKCAVYFLSKLFDGVCLCELYDCQLCLASMQMLVCACFSSPLCHII
jgi:hypothetical protein